MPLRLTNNRDIHLAQEWIVQLHRWIAKYGLEGYDPFDIKAHPRIRALQRQPLLRKGSTALCDLFPTLSRRALRVRPSLNPKAIALVALGDLRLFQITGDAVHLDNGLDGLKRLEALAVEGYRGPCWGYPFPVRAAGLDCPARTPVIVVCAIAGEAFLLAHKISNDRRYLDTAIGVSAFLLGDVPRVSRGGREWCFAYSLSDLRRVHNANLLAVEHILRTAARTGDAEALPEVQPALEFSLSAQREDGAWPYGVCDEDEPYEPALMRLVDHHHTGFVLRSLHGIHTAAPSTVTLEALRAGYQYYKNLVLPSGMPVNGGGRWPVDIHACAEGVLCNSVLSPSLPGALAKAVLVLRWSHYHLRNPRDGAPWHRKYPFFKSRMVFPRWGVAWMYRALAEYLYVVRDKYQP